MDNIFMNNIFWWFLKFFLMIYVAILVPVYYKNYGLKNFLWLSDIGLFLTVTGLWLNSSLLISMAAVGIILLELAWNIDFFVELIFKIKLINLASYMFDSSYSVTLRALSLFHIFTPIIWILYLAQNGYDNQAILYFTLMYWLILFLVYFFTSPKENINWVFATEKNHAIRFIPEPIWLIILFIFVPLLIFLPTHYIFIKLF